MSTVSYNGQTFQTACAARWAVFFDRLRIRRKYLGNDPSAAVDLGSLGRYVPDFWLPQVQMWAKVSSTHFGSEETQKCRALSDLTEYDVLMLDGVPNTQNYWGFTRDPVDGPILVDYVLNEPHCYWLSEHRFFMSSGADSWERINPTGHPIGCLCRFCDLAGAVAVALAARFDQDVPPR